MKYLLAFERNKQKQTVISKEKYPALVDGKDFSFSKRLIARSSMTPVGKQVFLGRCKVHKKYYLDRKHTNGEIRCPICESKWLRQQGFTK